MSHHRRLLTYQAATCRRATRFCQRNRFRVIAMNDAGVLKLFRVQERMLRRGRWAAHWGEQKAARISLLEER